MTHIIFFMPYKEIEKVVEEVFTERPDKDEISHETIVIPPGQNHFLANIQDGDVVIFRGFTAAANKNLKIPKVELTVTGYDVVIAVNECIKKFEATKIALIGTFNMLYGAETINEVYHDIDISCYVIYNEEQLGSVVERAKENGIQAIIGGRSAYEIAQSFGMHAVMLRSGKEAVSKAVDEAIRVAEITRREKEKSDRIQTIMNYTFEGIVSTDREGIITLSNKYASATLSKNGEDLIGEPIQKYFPALPINTVLIDEKARLSEIYNLEHMALSLNCVPLRGKQAIAGSVITFQDITRIQEEEGKIRKRMHDKGFIAKYNFGHIVWIDPIMKETIRKAQRFANSDSSLLIFGETGTGKELFAQSIHNASPRKNGPFVAVNCAALPDQLLESELFGHVEGAFTGAAKGGKVGLFEIAHNGTIFLDEIGDISPTLQTTLLRVLQEREIIRLGHDRVIPINVRVICATNKDLYEEVEKGNFRQDLLYRLEVLKLVIPPLRERKEDILRLIRQYIRKEQKKNACVLQGISASAQSILTQHSWPGNIRELINFCERLTVLCEKEYADEADVHAALEIGKRKTGEAAERMKSQNELHLKAYDRGEWAEEKEKIIEALKSSRFNRSIAAQKLDMDRSTLWRKMKKYGIL